MQYFYCKVMEMPMPTHGDDRQISAKQHIGKWNSTKIREYALKNNYTTGDVLLLLPK